MQTFDRVGPSPFRPDGTTIDTVIRFAGGSKLRVYGRSPYSNFRLRFSNESNEGWWVCQNSLDQLIAELLYIRRDTKKFKDGTALDIEVGRVGVESWEHPEDENEEEVTIANSEPGMEFGDMG